MQGPARKELKEPQNHRSSEEKGTAMPTPTLAHHRLKLHEGTGAGWLWAHCGTSKQESEHTVVDCSVGSFSQLVVELHLCFIQVCSKRFLHLLHIRAHHIHRLLLLLPTNLTQIRAPSGMYSRCICDKFTYVWNSTVNVDSFVGITLTGASVPEHAHGMPVALPPISPFPSFIHHRVQHCSSSVFVIMYHIT
jgi:hypothetical protein